MLTKRPTTYYVGYDYENNKEIYVFEIDVSDATELPETEINGDIIGNGSIAHIITTGDFYSYDLDSKTWYNQDGSDTPTDEQSDESDDSETVEPTNAPAAIIDKITFDPEVINNESVRNSESEQDTEIS